MPSGVSSSGLPVRREGGATAGSWPEAAAESRRRVVPRFSPGTVDSASGAASRSGARVAGFGNAMGGGPAGGTGPGAPASTSGLMVLSIVFG